MEFENYLRYGLGLIVVIGLIALMPLIARRFGMAGQGPPRRDKRLGVVELTAIDAKRRLVLVRRDAVEHLILLGVNSETVIERAITPPAPRSVVADGEKPDTGTQSSHILAPSRTEKT